ncbi:MAG: sigma-54 dependent transcriptional regulator [Polyangiaceae bacterium]
MSVDVKESAAQENERGSAAPIDEASRRVLVVDDDPNMCELIAASLGKAFEIRYKTSVEQALAEVAATDFDVVVTDLRMPRMGGLELCARVKDQKPDVPVVVMTAFGNFETAVAAIRAGAYDFITKPVQMDELRLVLDRVIAHRKLEREVRLLRRAVTESRSFGGLLGESPSMRATYDILDRVSGSEAAVLITGERGTGKDLVARTLHEKSKRSGKPFVTVNCATSPDPLLEIEMFGSSAASGGRAYKNGAFVEANGGTLLLDDIGELPISVQAKVLKAVSEGKVRPIGAVSDTPFNARVVATTHRDLASMVEEQRFREDLYYRINVVHVPLLPLRARGSDKLLLAQRFVEHFAARAGKPVVGLTPEAAQKIDDYAWPGNVRELSNCIERAVALTRCERLTVEDLPEKVRAYKPAQVVFPVEDPREIVPLEEVERRYILHVFEAVGRNRSLASQLLGVDRKTLYRKLEKYGAGKTRGGGAAGRSGSQGSVVEVQTVERGGALRGSLRFLRG